MKYHLIICPFYLIQMLWGRAQLFFTKPRIWGLVSMMDFMPGEGEHETGIFATFTGKVVPLEKWCHVVALRSCWSDVTHQ